MVQLYDAQFDAMGPPASMTATLVPEPLTAPAALGLFGYLAARRKHRAA
jgi:hypothetical protein